MSLSGAYNIDGNDLWDVYGVIVSKSKNKGKEAFLQFWDMKPSPIIKDWPDEAGKEYYLDARYPQEKQIQIDIVMTATSYDAFWAQHTAFFSLLSSPGTRRFYIDSLQRSFFIFYDSCTVFQTLTPLNGAFTGRIGCGYTLKLIEPVPSLFKQFTWLTDVNGNYITDINGNRILITT